MSEPVHYCPGLMSNRFIKQRIAFLLNFQIFVHFGSLVEVPVLEHVEPGQTVGDLLLTCPCKCAVDDVLGPNSAPCLSVSLVLSVPPPPSPAIVYIAYSHRATLSFYVCSTISISLILLRYLRTHTHTHT